MVDIRKVKKLIELLESSNMAEIEIKEGEESVRISRASQIYTHTNTGHIEASNAATTLQVATQQPPQQKPNGAVNNNEIPNHWAAVLSPMVGTFYRSSTPESKPFVEIGSEVKAGDVICIVEAMKMFNQIESDCSGIVKKVLIDNAEPVEYDQPLIYIEPL